MGKNKKIRSRINGLQRQIRLHAKKILEEETLTNPDPKTIGHWEHEIEVWTAEIVRLRRRLPQRK